MPSLSSRLQHAWNAFMNRDPTVIYKDTGPGFSYRPDRPRVIRGGERTIVSSILNRIALDIASTEIRHVRLDENDRYVEEIKSGLNNCLTLDANIDQTGRALVQDIALSMLDEGCVAVVPTDTTLNPNITSSYDILELRVGKIIQWYPNHVRVRLYNEKTGRQEDVTLAKSTVAIIENPMFAVMNEPNSTLQRLVRKLNILDVIDEQSGSGKLDMIIQLPYVIKTKAQQDQAERRRKAIEMQLAGSKYGIAYTDGTEHITQLNRSVDNQLMAQIEYLTSMLYGQLGMTAEILNGTADEKAMNNYYARIIEPCLSVIVDEMTRKYLTKTARSQHQAIRFFRDPFKLIPTTQIADIADRFTRNEIMSSNEFRQVIGLKPSADPRADELVNKNMPISDVETVPESEEVREEYTEDVDPDEIVSQRADDLDEIDAELDALEDLIHSDELKHYASKYYDPVKAHEYYMRTRELKGRKSTANLTDTGKEAASYVKDRLRSERDSKIKDSQYRKDREVATTNALRDRSLELSKKSLEAKIGAEKAKTLASIEKYAKQTKTRIEQLQSELSSYSKSEKAANRERIANEIAKLRLANKTKREKLNSSFSNSSKQLRSNRKAFSEATREEAKTRNDVSRSNHKARTKFYRQEFDSKYISELDNIRKDHTKTKKK